MDFVTTKETAHKWGVTERAIQKWAKEGKILGARKLGRAWMIPQDAPKPGESHDIKRIYRTPLPLLKTSFPIGKVLGYIKTTEDDKNRAMMLAEYYYYSGNPEKAFSEAEVFLHSDDSALRYSAQILCTFASLMQGHIHLATYLSEIVNDSLKDDLDNKENKASNENKAFGMLVAEMGRALLGIDTPDAGSLQNNLVYLPNGIRLLGCYILAYKAYNNGLHERALAICDTALAMCNALYPIPAIYSNLMAAACFMKLSKSEEAKKRYSAAWTIAEPDGLYEAFACHDSILYGLNEIQLKRKNPKAYKKIKELSRVYGDALKKLNTTLEDEVISHLSPTEFSTALLFSQGWRAKEIAEHMETSERTVYNNIQIIYDKLGIKGKKQLIEFMRE